MIAANKPRQSAGDRWFGVSVYLFIIMFALVCFIPFWMVFINSFAKESVLQTEGYKLWTTSVHLNAYQYVLAGKQVLKSYGVTLFVTIVGTVAAMLVTSTYAYVLSHRKVKYRNVLSFLTYFTMIFGAGLVGFYILMVSWLHLKDSIWAMILPYLLNPFYAFVLVAFFRNLPYEIYESATVDGVNDIRIFFRIMWPISTPALATVSLFYALQYWNDWWLSLLFIDNHDLHSLQMMIRQLMSSVSVSSYVGGGTQYTGQPPTEGVKLATVCLTIGPIVLLYPYVQKYFVKGLTIGSVKG
ncbi:carbohydrate ABC transporter permease [Cohnella soli]|uniref:Carbohydrate ABC transporter permease n=1 Tax=Cohnella soli TaxID=425005 RepID=A0ABW0I2A8_9BACL